MSGNESLSDAGLLLLLAILIIATISIRIVSARLRLPSLVGYLLIGFTVRALNDAWPFLSEAGNDAFHLLAELGLFALLFKVGLKSNLQGLLSQLNRAFTVWTGAVFVSGALGFAGSYFLLSWGLLPSVIIGCALTATSVGVCVAIWQDEDLLNTPDGQLLVDAAELDDITGVMIMAVVLAVVPAVHAGGEDSVWSLAGSSTVLVASKLGLVVAICYLFSRFCERKLTTGLFHSLKSPGPVLGVFGVGLLIAAMAAILDLSLAIGAFLAGLAFSRDPEEHTLQSSFEAIYEFFTPFFFIGIGLAVDPVVALGGLHLGLLLVVFAILGKLVGVFFAAWIVTSRRAALLLGISMIPRAEIALVIMQRTRELGDWAVPPHAFAAMVVVSAVTCTVAPLALHPLLTRWEKPSDASTDTAPEG